MAQAAVRPAQEARPDDLQELLGLARRELIRRGELVPPAWVDDAVQDLRTGLLVGWYVPPAAALGFASIRGRRAYGHVHVAQAQGALDNAHAVLTTLVDRLSPEIERFDSGVTGLSEADEVELGTRFRVRAGSEVLGRTSMSVDIPHDPPVPSPPRATGSLRSVGPAEVPIEALQNLDQRGFRGTIDETLLADTPGENARLLAQLIQGSLGRFLGEASRALLDDAGRPVAVILTAEQTTTSALYLDAVVDPSWQRKGVGEFLFRWSLRALRALGYSTAQLWVTDANAPARALYAKLGFRPRNHSVIYRWRRTSDPAVVPEQAQVSR
jgi:GNAT superfamily N-acetyltransferase